MKPKIFISGPMTGLPGYNREAFNAKADDLRLRGFIALNPTILPDGLTKAQYMDLCFAMIHAADGIHLLPGWESSDGSMAEVAYAKSIDLPITKDGEK